jgi:hypothetical protein
MGRRAASDRAVDEQTTYHWASVNAWSFNIELRDYLIDHFFTPSPQQGLH